MADNHLLDGGGDDIFVYTGGRVKKLVPRCRTETGNGRDILSCFPTSAGVVLQKELSISCRHKT